MLSSGGVRLLLSDILTARVSEKAWLPGVAWAVLAPAQAAAGLFR